MNTSCIWALEDLDHNRTTAKGPQINGICVRFHKTVLNKFYRVAFRKKIYKTLDAWLKRYNQEEPHLGR